MSFFPGLFSSWGAQQFILLMIYINLGLAAFNIIPIPPLDGSRILYVLLPYQCMKYYYWLERYGMFVVVGLLVLGIFPYIMYPIMTVLFTSSCSRRKSVKKILVTNDDASTPKA